MNYTTEIRNLKRIKLTNFQFNFEIEKKENSSPSIKHKRTTKTVYPVLLKDKYEFL